MPKDEHWLRVELLPGDCPAEKKGVGEGAGGVEKRHGGKESKARPVPMHLDAIAVLEQQARPLRERDARQRVVLDGVKASGAMGDDRRHHLLRVSVTKWPHRGETE